MAASVIPCKKSSVKLLRTFQHFRDISPRATLGGETMGIISVIVVRAARHKGHKRGPTAAAEGSPRGSSFLTAPAQCDARPVPGSHLPAHPLPLL